MSVSSLAMPRTNFACPSKNETETQIKTLWRRTFDEKIAQIALAHLSNLNSKETNILSIREWQLHIESISSV